MVGGLPLKKVSLEPRVLGLWYVGEMFTYVRLVHPGFKGASCCVSVLLLVLMDMIAGCMKGGSRAVKEHKWFQGMDWEAVYNGQVKQYSQVCS